MNFMLEAFRVVCTVIGAYVVCGVIMAVVLAVILIIDEHFRRGNHGHFQ